MRIIRSAIIAAAILSAESTNADGYIIHTCNAVETATATQMVSDINPGATGSDDHRYGFSSKRELMIRYDGGVYFPADDGSNGTELWRVKFPTIVAVPANQPLPPAPFDPGTPELVQDIAPGGEGSEPHSFVIFQGKLYFAATTPATGEELFVYDGSTVSLAADIEPGPASRQILGLTVHDGTIFFLRHAGPSTEHYEVYSFDGSTATPVDGLNNQPFVLRYWEGPVTRYLQSFNGKLYFEAWTDLPEQHELWSWDGVSAQKVKGLTPGSHTTSDTFDFAVFDGALHFGVRQGTPSNFSSELWRVTAQGSVEFVAEISANDGTAARDLEAFAGQLYFAGPDFGRLSGNSAQSLSNNMLLPQFTRNLTAYLNGQFSLLFFAGVLNDNSENREPLVFDGQNLARLKEIRPGTGNQDGSHPSRGVQLANKLYFYADDGVHGRELWVHGTYKRIGRCHIVAATVWDKWWEWPIDIRRVIVEVRLVEPSGRVRKVLDQTMNAQRGQEMRMDPIAFLDESTGQQESRELRNSGNRDQASKKAAASLDTAIRRPHAFGLFTTIIDSETSTVIDTGFETIGTPSSREKAVIDRQIAELRKRYRPGRDISKKR